MTDRYEEIKRLGAHLNCAQQVLLRYCEEYNLRQEMAIKIAAAFGGGIGQMGEICGAVTGAFMVIGLKYGSLKDDKEATKKKEEIISTFLREFRSRNRFIKCKELLGFDMSIPEEFDLIKERELTQLHCPKFINDSIEILHDILSVHDIAEKQ